MSELADIITRLDRIIELLELQTFVPEDAAPPPCPHKNAVDRGVMGMRPGERMECKDCGEIFSRIKE